MQTIPMNNLFSYNVGELPKGCQYCVRGEKLVSFVTGICPRRCYFCPISDAKYGKDVCFANERKVVEDNDLFIEADAMAACGAGITGGDPLAKLPRTLRWIRELKKKYTNKFHVHLYTSLNLVTEETLKQLADTGLDEIRFHLDLENEQLWQRLSLAKKFDWDIGVELPCIPRKEKMLVKAIDFIQKKADFLVLNELEVADNSMSKLIGMGYQTKNELSYAIKGSQEIGLKLLNYVQEQGYPLRVHFCTAKLKDRVQLGNRIKREGNKVKRVFDIIDDEGLLIRGALYLPKLVPGFGYRKKLAATNKNVLLPKLRKKAQEIREELQAESDMVVIDEDKLRILLPAKDIKKNKKFFLKKGLIPGIVKEYPTADQLEIEVELLNN